MRKVVIGSHWKCTKSRITKKIPNQNLVTSNSSTHQSPSHTCRLPGGRSLPGSDSSGPVWLLYSLAVALSGTANESCKCRLPRRLSTDGVEISPLLSASADVCTAMHVTATMTVREASIVGQQQWVENLSQGTEAKGRANVVPNSKRLIWRIQE